MNQTLKKTTYHETHMDQLGIFAITQVHRNAIALLQPLDKKRLLDLGCGNGELCFLADQAGAQVIGIDFQPTALAMARMQVPRAIFYENSIIDYPIPAASIDRIAALGVLGYLSQSDLIHVLNRCHATLANEGLLVIRTATKQNRIGIFLLKLFNKNYVSQDYCRWDREYRKLINQTGFTITKSMRSIDRDPSIPLSPWRRIIDKLATPFLAVQWYVCKKKSLS